VGGVLALVLAYGAFALFRGSGSGPLAGLVFFSTPQMLGLLSFGVLLGLLGSLFSVGRHLQAV
jgi:hypothetical protein